MFKNIHLQLVYCVRCQIPRKIPILLQFTLNLHYVKVYLQKWSTKQRCYSKGKKKWFGGSEGSHCREPHNLRLLAVARGHPGTGPLPPDAEDACMVELSHISAAGSRLSGEALPALGWSLRSARRGSCPEPAAAGRAINAAPSQISFSPSNTCTQSKEQTETEDLCPGNLKADNAFPWSSAALLASHGPPRPSDAVGMPTFFLRGKQGRTNHLHRLNTTPGPRHRHPS